MKMVLFTDGKIKLFDHIYTLRIFISDTVTMINMES